jgi:hypothetical protein
MGEPFIVYSSKLPKTSHHAHLAVQWAFAEAFETTKNAIVWCRGKATPNALFSEYEYISITQEDADRIDKAKVLESYRIQRFRRGRMAAEEIHVYVLDSVEMRLHRHAQEMQP